MVPAQLGRICIGEPPGLIDRGGGHSNKFKHFNNHHFGWEGWRVGSCRNALLPYKVRISDIEISYIHSIDLFNSLDFSFQTGDIGFMPINCVRIGLFRLSIFQGSKFLVQFV